jgi:acetyltransferase-like isoleucine patch superfamily enzyme
MRARFINQRMFMLLVNFRNNLLRLRTWYFRTFYAMNIAPDVRLSFKARIDKTNPRGLTIGKKTMVTFDAVILSHDYSSRQHDAKTVIGSYCFIGCASVVLPNINIGDHVIVAAGSVVTKDIPSNCIVAGNPAKIIKTGIDTTDYGMLTEEYIAAQSQQVNSAEFTPPEPQNDAA